MCIEAECRHLQQVYDALSLLAIWMSESVFPCRQLCFHQGVQGVPALMCALGHAVQDTAVQHNVLLETLDAVQVRVMPLPLKHQHCFVDTFQHCIGFALAKIQRTLPHWRCQPTSCFMPNCMSDMSHSCRMHIMCAQWNWYAIAVAAL